MSWSYAEGDPGLKLFTAVEALGYLPMLVNGRVLEIGCCEADWLHLAKEAWRETDFIGIDTRAQGGPVPLKPFDGPGRVRLQRWTANAMDADTFPPESFNAVVSISAIEHVGLGHYKDPVDPDGDTKAIANAWRWLKPGGWLYFDVPFDPGKYYLYKATKCRVYDWDAVWNRLWMEPLCQTKGKAKWLYDGYVKGREAGTLLPCKPVEAVEPFHYMAMVWQKV